MKLKKWAALSAIAILLLALLACTISFGGNNQTNDVKSAIQMTLQVLQTQTAAAAGPAQPPSGNQSSNNSSSGSNTPNQPENPPAPTLTVNPTPCNVSRMAGENVPDGTQFDAGDTFTKTWKVRNIGACAWNKDYRLVFEEGDRMGGEKSQDLEHTVQPGDEITLSVDLTAPDDDGEYTGVWRLTSDTGEKLGKYWVNIFVGNPPGPFAVTSVTFYMPHTTIDTGCPNDLNVKAEITANGAGKVTYKWKDSEGGTSSTKSHTFDEAGKKIVEYNVHATSSGDYWAKLYIDSPNHQWFGPIDFHVNCTP